ncbi:hypothetical protein CU102_22470 [Phyllobacterium brassicacearum]|uniref:Uncharacterized protein n=1 Tax=Phyllobacterium brassicacearum TaxID=314235 RepID=A0A2P7BCS8_9HYPH|nr:hypothetical protein CU102_22470 [Phyllobacterium brassicacearum]TDQ12834.1 hypothetical protein DEV91_1477 [Phyllobacterium brassicacearum]
MRTWSRETAEFHKLLGSFVRGVSQQPGLMTASGPTPDFRSTGEGPAHAAIVGATYFADVDMHFDDTRAAPIHRKEQAKTETEFLKDRGILVTDNMNPFQCLEALFRRSPNREGL